MPATESSAITFVALVALLILVAAVVISSRLPSSIKVLLCTGLGLRVMGSLIRYEVLFKFYDGSGDARVYYNMGLRYIDDFRKLKLSVLFDPAAWWGGTLAGTQFVRFVSGGVLAIIGPSLRSEFLVFSLFAFAGLALFAAAFARSYPKMDLSRYLAWIMLFPSLWYWPSSIGKEAVLFLGLGLTVFGFVGRRGRVNWIVMGTGLLIVYLTRPEFVAILFVAILLSQWSFFQGRWTFGKIVQMAGLAAVCLVGIWFTSQRLGIEQFDVEGIQSYVESEKGREATGGTQVEPLGTNLTALPVAFFNVLFRPLPWEATNIMVLLSSLEIVSLWTIVAWKRKHLLNALRDWSSDRLVRLSVLFILFYATALGMMLVNLGIIARQRVFLFPFVFLLLRTSAHAAKRVPARRTLLFPSSRRGQYVKRTQPTRPVSPGIR